MPLDAPDAVRWSMTRGATCWKWSVTVGMLDASLPYTGVAPCMQDMIVPSVARGVPSGRPSAVAATLGTVAPSPLKRHQPTTPAGAVAAMQHAAIKRAILPTRVAMVALVFSTISLFFICVSVSSARTADLARTVPS